MVLQTPLYGRITRCMALHLVDLFTDVHTRHGCYQVFSDVAIQIPNRRAGRDEPLVSFCNHHIREGNAVASKVLDDRGDDGDCVSTFGRDFLGISTVDQRFVSLTSFLSEYTPSASKPSPPSRFSCVVPRLTQTKPFRPRMTSTPVGPHGGGIW